MTIVEEIAALEAKLIKKTASLSDFLNNKDRDRYIVQLRILIQYIAYLNSIGDTVGAETFITFAQKTYL
jgi:hypothetical protein